MFAFDHWADWLESKAAEWSRENLTRTYGDTRSAPECASNPAFSIQVRSPERIGRLSFWRNGMCDYEVMETSSRDFIANEAMLEANDQTAPVLVAQFWSFFAQPRS